MSEPINKILASTSQSFTDAEKEIARNNIGAMPASASAGISTVYHDSNFTGSGTSASPIGLASAVWQMDGTNTTVMRPGSVQYSAGSLSSLHAGNYSDWESTHWTAQADSMKLRISNDSGVSAQVDLSSIQRWNNLTTLSANNGLTGDGTSGSPFGLDSAIRFESGDSANSVGRRGSTVSTTQRTAWYYAAFASFENNSSATANYRADRAEFSDPSGSEQVDRSSIYRWNHPDYYCIIRKPGANTTQYVTTANYPSGLTADARLDILNLGPTAAGSNYVVYDRNSQGATRTLSAGQSGTVWWDSQASAWTTLGTANE